MIAKSSTNPVFLSARTGAEAAAKELSQKHNVPIEIVLADAAGRGRPGAGAAHRAGGQRGRERDADLLLGRRQGHRRDQRRRRARRAGDDVRQRRAAVEAVRLLRRGRREDRPGGDGRARARRWARRATIAILAGNQNAPNLRKRVDGREAGSGEAIPDIKIVGTFYHIETPQDAAAEVIRVQNAYPEIQGWAMIGGWPLFTQTLLTDLDPDEGRRSSRSTALPAELAYVEKGLAPVLLAQPTYSGATSACSGSSTRCSSKKDVPQIIPMELVRVTKDNLGTWARQLKDWGFTDVPDEYLK